MHSGYKLRVVTFGTKRRGSLRNVCKQRSMERSGVKCFHCTHVFDLTNLKGEKRRNVGKLNNELNIVNQLVDLHFLLFVNITGNWKNRLAHTRQIIIADWLSLSESSWRVFITRRVLFLFLPCNCLLHHVEDYAMNFWTAHFSWTNQVCGIMI